MLGGYHSPSTSFKQRADASESRDNREAWRTRGLDAVERSMHRLGVLAHEQPRGVAAAAVAATLLISCFAVRIEVSMDFMRLYAPHNSEAPTPPTS